MSIIKLSAIGSTNSYLRALCAKKELDDYTVVVTENQTQGRGQMATEWCSQPAKNLTFSVYKDTSGFQIEHPFYISIVVSLTLLRTLRFFSIPKLSVKWPNDILSENSKVCGILIENAVRQNKMNSSIIGIGLNVNQTEFKNLPKASSLKIITGVVYNLDEIITIILSHLRHYFDMLIAGQYAELKEEYDAYLFRKNKPSTFQDAEGRVFSGFINNVCDSGNLQILLEDDVLKEYTIKEITLLY
ncbi:MAG: biotin--[acetyl-CoA-carboxylase] ligase [Aestuariibaculum sp.]